MAKEAGRAGRAESSETGYVCPVCKQPVQTVIKRRKILGAWVPMWIAGPCQNADCEARSDDEAAGAHHRPEPSGEPPEEPAERS
ncbi:hypothetical protein U9R90_10970 [Streptomyces sp. E11-3]|uniref:hypothetical protein n=1 Tax=Streptomyces sp. E11-3 TaxID=3110112 RepID=UPI00397F4D9D